MASKMNLVMVIVNSGYSEDVMKAGLDIGARGGTIFNAFGSASLNAEKLYGIHINPEKEVVMILVAPDITKKLLKKIYEDLGSDSLAQGIAFALPVDEATSNLVSQYKKDKKNEGEKRDI